MRKRRNNNERLKQPVYQSVWTFKHSLQFKLRILIWKLSFKLGRIIWCNHLFRWDFFLSQMKPFQCSRSKFSFLSSNKVLFSKKNCGKIKRNQRISDKIENMKRKLDKLDLLEKKYLKKFILVFSFWGSIGQQLQKIEERKIIRKRWLSSEILVTKKLKCTGIFYKMMQQVLSRWVS